MKGDVEQIFAVVQHNGLFQSIDSTQFQQMLKCIGATTASYEKDEVVMLSGSPVKALGIVLSGCVEIIKEDKDGNDNIIATIQPGDAFGEALVCAGVKQSPVTVVALVKSQVFFIDYNKMLNTCSNTCIFHHQLISNMLSVIAKKNLFLNQKLEILSKRTIRERLLLFLKITSNGGKKFTIPLNREGLARYLCVDRSAMCKEMGKMRQEGLIEFHKNHFEILD